MLAEIPEMILIVFGVFTFVIISNFLILLLCYKKVPMGQASVRNGVGGLKVSFSGQVVIPCMHKHEYMDITLKRIAVDCAGEQSLVCKDGVKADAKVAFFVRVNNTVQDVSQVASTLGCQRASNMDTLKELFYVKFLTALKSVVESNDFDALSNAREDFIDKLISTVGDDLGGFVLDAVTIDYFEAKEEI